MEVLAVADEISWLTRTGKAGDHARFVDQAEQWVLWDIDAAVEGRLTEPFLPTTEHRSTPPATGSETSSSELRRCRSVTVRPDLRERARRCRHPEMDPAKWTGWWTCRSASAPGSAIAASYRGALRVPMGSTWKVNPWGVVHSRVLGSRRWTVHPRPWVLTLWPKRLGVRGSGCWSGVVGRGGRRAGGDPGRLCCWFRGCRRERPRPDASASRVRGCGGGFRRRDADRVREVDDWLHDVGRVADQFGQLRRE